MFQSIYGLRNSERDQYKMGLHLVEVAGGLAKILRKGDTPRRVASFVGKLLAWYSALAARLNYRGIEDIIWRKYPFACSRCGQAPCNCPPDADLPMLDHSTVRKLEYQNRTRRPRRLQEWQAMFFSIYGTPARLLETKDQGNIKAQLRVGLSRLNEELGELSEVIRLEHINPLLVPNELPDVFAWIMAIANVLPAYLGDPEFSLEQVLWSQYPGRCTYCQHTKCLCPNDRVRQSLITSAGVEGDKVIDQLTGLQGKDAFNSDFSEQISTATDRTPLSLLFMDLDRFKHVNDTWGHEFGDEVLRSSAEVLRKIVALYEGHAYRWGGEEFAVLLPNRQAVEAQACAERIRLEMRARPCTTPSGGKPYFATASFGVGTLGTQAGQPIASVTRTFFDAVDKAVYQAKQDGRDRIVIANAFGPQTLSGSISEHRP